jgi:maleate isomerase
MRGKLHVIVQAGTATGPPLLYHGSRPDDALSVRTQIGDASVYTNVDNQEQKNAGKLQSAILPVLRNKADAMTRTLRLGVLTPSSNTALEPLTTAIVAALPGASTHFSRFRVTEISLSAQALDQFDDSKILAAAELLVDAKVDVIGWSGTSSGWLGFDADRRLCERIQERTGVPATTAVLALNELLAIKGVRRLALVTPYTADVQRRIIDNYASLDIEVVAERHLDISVNHAFAAVDPQRLRALIAEVAQARPQAITTFCTNLHAASLAGEVEQSLRIPLLDTVSTTVWGMLRAAGAAPADVRGWGELFQWS